ncbi:hypothetical protein DDE82_006013 [Stemphylium lycopersici]|nr:hypothetical protein DDE82_006013 [Stemphylium lycopersici]
MATFDPRSHSPRVSDLASSQMLAGNLMTPVHSPHHSVTSSISSRTPIHTLTIHEYRKQQHTPTLSRKGTPPGKTLRRKPAASALNDIERANSVPPSNWSDSGPSLRPLHFSQSAHQLKTAHPSFQQQTRHELPLRAQSTEPRQQTGSISSLSTVGSSKVRYFNSRKRLPKPPATTGAVAFPPSFPNASSVQTRRPTPPAALSFSTECTQSGDAQTTPTPSTFSLSRFPQPPHRIDPLLSPPRDERDSAHVEPLNFTTATPATPPATPAIIHYRGASFDLVNPHDSLLLHDIVTPSRDFDSSDYIAVRTSDEAFLEMAPKRPVYGDFRAAHAGILRRPEDSPSQSYADLPAPPTPTTVSPNSSSYTSPMYSPDSADVPSPLLAKTPARESRFSLKGLTRSLTQKLGRSPAKPQDEELRDIHNRRLSMESISMNLDFPRPLKTYDATPEMSYLPVGPMSPATPTSPMSPDGGLLAFPPGQGEVEVSRKYSANHYGSQPLASMIPNDPSTQVGQIDNSQLPYSEGGGFTKPYYDDLDSIYPSSSVYTRDGHRKSDYQQGLSSKGNSNDNLFASYSSTNKNDFADEYNRESSYGYNGPNRVERQMPRLVPQEMSCRSPEEADPKADTISKLIDEYSPHDTTENTLPIYEQGISRRVADAEDHQRPVPASELTQFEFGIHETPAKCHDTVGTIYRGVPGRTTIAQNPGLPPRQAPPLAPAFKYNDTPFSSHPGFSGILSHGSSYSYGDTRNLLQISRSEVSVQLAIAQTLEPSSSYSQSEAKNFEPSSSYSQAEAHSPHTPKEALDQAEQIFQDTVDQHRSDDKIPTIWARRNSGSQLLGKPATTRSSGPSQDSSTSLNNDGSVPAERADWETVGGNSRDSKGHESLGSIADYSSSEGTRESLGMNSDGSLPSWVKQAQLPARSSYYNHPSPIPTQHPHPFSSSPPELKPRSSICTAPNTSSSPLPVEPPASRATPVLRLLTHREHTLGRGGTEQTYPSAPWTDPYAFSDKETQELLASGPNDNIIIDEQAAAHKHRSGLWQRYRSEDITSMARSPEKSVFDSSPVGLERQNTFEKLSVAGPKGNLTGTPRGTGMHETGSSVADTSSPGLRLSSSVGRQSFRSDYTGFYAAPFPATGSVTRISQTKPTHESHLGRNPSETTPFSNSKGLEAVQETSSLPGTRQHLRNSTTFLRNQRRTSRSAVAGQTKLRQMFLAPEVRSTPSIQAIHITPFMGGSDRPSTSDTNTPLRTSYPSIEIYPAPTRSTIAHEHSPHLLCVERKANPEDEARRRKLSWLIFAAFCLLPPCIILFRFLGDNVIASLTEGRLGHCTPKSKRTALIAGIAVNVGLVTAILVPVLVIHALNDA